MLIAFSWTPFLIIYCCIAVFLTVFYCYIIRRYIREWDALKEWEIPANFSPKTKISILIPARNEADNIGACLDSIQQQNYPPDLFEVIVINDHSEDTTAEIVRSFKFAKLIELSDHLQSKSINSYKKKAIEIAITKSSGNLIVCTDADCIAPKNWLKYFASIYENTQAKFIAGPVNFYKEQNLIERFQSLDFVGMMCVTGAGIHGQFMNTCNGANLAYDKNAFYEVNGFEGINNIASGDDILLMHKMSKAFPDKIAFLKNRNATIFTKAKPTVKSFFNQRLRWATKNSGYGEWEIIFILAMVLFLCMSIVFSLLSWPYFGGIMLMAFGFQLFFKTLADYFFLGKMSTYFHKNELMKSFIPAQFLHILYIVVVGIAGNFVKRYEWKGREVR